MMNKKAVIILNHSLTREQIEDLQKNWGVAQIVQLPEEFRKLWGNIPPELDEEGLKDYLKPLLDFLQKELKKEDVVVIQGDFGATYFVVSFLKERGVTSCLYATTKRIVTEKREPSGEVRTIRTFKHVRFRRYI